MTINELSGKTLIQQSKFPLAGSKQMNPTQQTYQRCYRLDTKKIGRSNGANGTQSNRNLLRWAKLSENLAKQKMFQYARCLSSDSDLAKQQTFFRNAVASKLEARKQFVFLSCRASRDLTTTIGKTSHLNTKTVTKGPCHQRVEADAPVPSAYQANSDTTEKSTQDDHLNQTA